MSLPAQSAEYTLLQKSGVYPTKWQNSSLGNLGASSSKKACNCGCAVCQGKKN